MNDRSVVRLADEEAATGWEPVIVHARFANAAAARRVHYQLRDRGYLTGLALDGAGVAILTVTTPAVLRAEVSGLIWLSGGQER